MATKQETITINGSMADISIARKTSKSGSMSWTIPTLPDNAVIISTKLTAQCTLNMTLGSGTYTVNGISYSSSSSISIDLGTSLVSSVAVTAKGANIFSYGILSASNIVYSVTYQYEEKADPPIITIQSQDRSKISSVSGYDRCTVAFTADQALSYWEARATIQGVTPTHGVGLLVESGTLNSGETGYVYVDDDELTNGDIEYTVSIFGQNADGVWSDE